jgi:aminoglycoside phosphotransferase
MLATSFICLWIFMMLVFLWSVIRASQKAASQLKRLHQIPCHKCDFFTNDYRLKCTVDPIQACTEEAISCIHFEAKTKSGNASHKHRQKLS